MSVFVVMGNDFPDAVFSTEEKADAYINLKKDEEALRMASEQYPRRVYWRSYEFGLDVEAVTVPAPAPAALPDPSPATGGPPPGCICAGPTKVEGQCDYKNCNYPVCEA